MSFTGVDSLDRGIHTTNRWLADIATGFGTEDRRFAYRVLRAWSHTLRDRLTVEAAAHLAAQLPDPIRGMYYDGWNPSHVPHKYDVHEFAARFADEAGIGREDVPKAAAIVTEVVLFHVEPGAVAHAFGLMPIEIRALLQPGGGDSS
ncbi:DUF2267 domain-containing protein [Actinoallomurus sp. NPDC050550]|uniref:DUF2267 domain-containing protein n=1 Tax=Actinoallomurus sp. NPDC050550 TaxID=3154937 RepID=UPI003408A528